MDHVLNLVRPFGRPSHTPKNGHSRRSSPFLTLEWLVHRCSNLCYRFGSHLLKNLSRTAPMFVHFRSSQRRAPLTAGMFSAMAWVCMGLPSRVVGGNLIIVAIAVQVKQKEKLKSKQFREVCVLALHLSPSHGKSFIGRQKPCIVTNGRCWYVSLMCAHVCVCVCVRVCEPS